MSLKRCKSSWLKQSVLTINNDEPYFIFFPSFNRQGSLPFLDKMDVSYQSVHTFLVTFWSDSRMVYYDDFMDRDGLSWWQYKSPMSVTVTFVGCERPVMIIVWVQMVLLKVCVTSSRILESLYLMLESSVSTHQFWLVYLVVDKPFVISKIKCNHNVH